MVLKDLQMSYLTCLVLEDGPLEWITFEREWNLVKTPGIWCHVQLSTNISSELGKLVIREFEFLMRFSFRTEHGDPRSFNQECQLFHFFLTTLVQVVKNGFCKASGNERKKPVPTPKPKPFDSFFFYIWSNIPSITGQWIYHCRRLSPATWSGKRTMTSHLSCFG